MSWRSVVLATAFTALGFVAGILAAPRLRHGDEIVRAEEPGTTPIVAPPAAVREGQEVARRLLAAAKLAPAPAAGQGTISAEQMPAPVKQALTAMVAGRPFKQGWVERRLRNGNPLYRVKVDIEGVEHHVSFDEQGKVLQSEIDLGATEIPERVHRVVGDALPESVILKAKKMTGTEYPAPYYQVSVRFGGGQRELEINEAGEILRDRGK